MDCGLDNGSVFSPFPSILHHTTTICIDAHSLNRHPHSLLSYLSLETGTPQPSEDDSCLALVATAKNTTPHHSRGSLTRRQSKQGRFTNQKEPPSGHIQRTARHGAAWLSHVYIFKCILSSSSADEHYAAESGIISGLDHNTTQHPPRLFQGRHAIFTRIQYQLGCQYMGDGMQHRS